MDVYRRSFSFEWYDVVCLVCVDLVVRVIGSEFFEIRFLLSSLEFIDRGVVIVFVKDIYKGLFGFVSISDIGLDVEILRKKGFVIKVDSVVFYL